MRTISERQQFLLELVDKYGAEPVRTELGLSEATFESYLNTERAPKRMAPDFRLHRARLKLERKECQ